MRVKVCGMTSLEQILQLDEWGVPFAGMIFYEKSPRYVKKFNLSAIDVRREKLKINRVGVFVNESVDNILKTVEEWRLDMVQLHGDESPKFCEQVSNHVHTIKAFRLSADDPVEWKVYPYQAFTDMFLFDSGTTGATPAYGGTGLKFNWDSLQKADLRKPFMLSGGIGPDDVAAVKAFAAAQKDMFAVDVNSKFELSPGFKDMTLIRSFLNELNA